VTGLGAGEEILYGDRGMGGGGTAGRWRREQRRKERRRRSWLEGSGTGKMKTKRRIRCLLCWFVAERMGGGHVAPPVGAVLLKEGEYFVVR
jgi:hypothetical protein